MSEGPRPGDKIGPYRLVRLLGAGASGQVFEVEHEKLGRRAAMKTLAPEHAAHPGAITRLFTEARAINRINHPHIVEVTDLLEAHPPGARAPAIGANAPVTAIGANAPVTATVTVNAIVMELLEGQSLGHAMITEGPLEPERFLPILAQVCRALAAAHAAGFVHRDLKPDNVFLVDRGRDEDFVKLLDFGLAKPLRRQPGGAGDTPLSVTLDGTFVGTPGYVSPEQAGAGAVGGAAANAGSAVDHRGDIYAVGVTLFELVCGHLPFEGSSLAELLIQHIHAAPPRLPDDVRATKLGATLDAIVQRCLEKDPAARFSSAAQLAQLFDQLARGDEVTFPGIERYLESAGSPRASRRRELVRATLGLSIGLLLALGVGLVLLRLARPSAAARLTTVIGPPARPLSSSAGASPPRGALPPRGAVPSPPAPVR